MDGGSLLLGGIGYTGRIHLLILSCFFHAFILKWCFLHYFFSCLSDQIFCRIQLVFNLVWYFAPQNVIYYFDDCHLFD